MKDFTLDPSLEIRDVEAVRTHLLAALEGSTGLRIDLTPVVAVDSAGVQLLIALQHEARDRRVALEFHGTSGVLRQIALNLGLPPFEGAE